MSTTTANLALSPPPSSTTTIKPPARSKSTNLSSSSSSRASHLSSHLQMIELKNRILTSLNKLSDRDTHQIAVEDLDKISQTLAPDSIPMFLNCLYDAAADIQHKPIVRKHSIKLLAAISFSHPESLSSHLPKIIAHIVKRIKDPDSGIREACQSAVGALAEQYLKEGEQHDGGLVLLMVKPFLDALNEQNKIVQAVSAICLARLVDCARDPPVEAFQKLCRKVCKFLGNPHFFAKAPLLSLVSSLAKVEAIAPQSMPVLMQCILECLQSSDWSTRKAAADVLSHLASHLSRLVTDGGASTVAALEACPFDKVKPVRDSMAEALQQWKNVTANSEETELASPESKNVEANQHSEKVDIQRNWFDIEFLF